MIKNLPILYIALILLTTCFIACDKTDPGPPTNGKLTGTIQTWNDKTTAIADKGGITVTTEYPNVYTTTIDTSGKFSFDNLDFDKYDISFSKPGYGTYRIFSYAHNNNPLVSDTSYTVYTPPIGTSSTIATDGFTNDELTGFGFSKGQKIYIKAYGESLRGNDYDDPNLRKRVFPNLNPTTATAIFFIMQ